MVKYLRNWLRISTRAEMADRKVMTVPEAGQKLGISRNSAYQAAREGQIPTIRIGRRLLVPVAAFERFLDGDHQPKQEAVA